MEFVIMKDGNEHAILSLGELSGAHPLVAIQNYLRIVDCPSSPLGLTAGMVYKDSNGFLKIVS